MTTDQTVRLIIFEIGEDADYPEAMSVADIIEIDLPEAAFKNGKPSLGLSSVGKAHLSNFGNYYAEENFFMTLERGPFEVTPHGA